MIIITHEPYTLSVTIKAGHENWLQGLGIWRCSEVDDTVNGDGDNGANVRGVPTWQGYR
jgi:hypothetical protein